MAASAHDTFDVNDTSRFTKLYGARGNDRFSIHAATVGTKFYGGKSNDEFKIGDPSDFAGVGYYIIAGSGFDRVIFKGDKWKKKTGSSKWEVFEHGPETEGHATFYVTGAFKVKIR